MNSVTKLKCAHDEYTHKRYIISTSTYDYDEQWVEKRCWPNADVSRTNDLVEAKLFSYCCCLMMLRFDADTDEDDVFVADFDSP